MKKIIIYCIVSVVLFGCSYLLGQIFAPSKSSSSMQQTKIVREVLPKKILKDYSLQKMNANMTGTVTEVSKDNVTIQTPNGTTFKGYNEPQGITTVVDNTGKTLKFGDIKVGDNLVGGISIVVAEEAMVGSTGNRKAGDVVLHYVQVNNEKSN